jgi:hypothetical protein
MKRPESLGQQVRDAQRVVGRWSKEKRRRVRLEGWDIYQSRARQQEPRNG